MSDNHIPTSTFNDLKVRTGSGGIAKVPVVFYQGGQPISGEFVGYDFSHALVRTPSEGLVRVPKDTPAKLI